MSALVFAWLSAVAFAASLAYFLYAYFILFDPPQPTDAAPVLRPVAINVLLFTVFALHHSVFARTGMKQLVSAVAGPAVERAVYSFAASLLFLGVCWWWQPVPGVLYVLEDVWRWTGLAVIVTGVLITAIAARALDIWELAGVRQVRDASRASLPPRPLETRGVYGFVRHPLYFGWALVVFGAPQMSMTRFTFAVVSTLYLAVAIPFEERDLIETFGPDYASYRRKVRWRMLPGIY